MKIVYWSNFPDNNLSVSELKYFDPVPLIQELDILDFFGPASMCPAILDDLKKTFVIKAPIDFDLQFNQYYTETICNFDYSPEFIDYYIGPFSTEKVFQLASPSYIFFTEDNTEITQLPAFYSSSSIYETCIGLSGTYNISSWLRPIKPAFKLLGSRIKINRGDPLFYLRFNTSEKIKLQKFDSSELNTGKYSQIIDAMAGYKFNKPKSNVIDKLSDLYLSFNKSKYKKIILKNIKENLL